MSMTKALQLRSINDSVVHITQICPPCMPRLIGVLDVAQRYLGTYLNTRRAYRFPVSRKISVEHLTT